MGYKRRARAAAIGSLAATALIVAACGGDDEGESTVESVPERTDSVATSEVATSAVAASAPAATTTTSHEGDDDLSIAYLSASSANTWLQSSIAEMRQAADGEGARIVEFDGQFDGNLQTTQLQDVVASGEYDGVILVAINGPGIVPEVVEALDAGLEVVVLNQVVGDDLTTADPQVEGVSASVLAPPSRSGERMGELTVQACEDMDPCRVVYLYGIKGAPIDVALKDGLDSVVSGHPNIEIVAEGEGQYLGPEGGIDAIQDIMQAQPQFDVVVGADQSIQGVETVLADEGMLATVKLIGLGGSAPAISAITDGRWFGGVMGAPGDEGRLAMEALVKAIRTGEHSGGIDPIADLPSNGLITKDVVGDFSPQWNG